MIQNRKDEQNIQLQPLCYDGEQEDCGNRSILLPMMPLRGMLVFPYMIIHLDVGRDRSINAIDKAMLGDEHLLFLTMQKDSQTDEPRPEDVYNVGTVVQIRQLLKLPGGTLRLLVEGLWRAEMECCVEQQPYLLARIHPLEESLTVSDLEMEALMRSLSHCFEEYARASRKISPEALVAVTDIEDPERLADLIAAQLHIRYEERQRLLEETCINVRMELIMTYIYREMEILSLEQNITERVRRQMEQSQKEYYLREQLKAVQQELGEKDERGAEVAELRKKAAIANLPAYVVEKLEKELERLAKMPSMMAEATVIQNYIDWLIDMPWYQQSKETRDIKKAERILNADHYGLQKPKERILEYLATDRKSTRLNSSH